MSRKAILSAGGAMSWLAWMWARDRKEAVSEVYITQLQPSCQPMSLSMRSFCCTQDEKRRSGWAGRYGGGGRPTGEGRRRECLRQTLDVTTPFQRCTSHNFSPAVNQCPF